MSWDPPTPRAGMPLDPLSEEEFQRFLELQNRFASSGRFTGGAGTSALPTPQGLSLMPSPIGGTSTLPTPTMVSPTHQQQYSTPQRPPLSRSSSRSARGGSGGGGGGGCCGGSATNASSPQRRSTSQRESPIGSPAYRTSGRSSPAGSVRRGILDPRPTPHGASYACDGSGDIILNREGQDVMQKMHEYATTVFRRHTHLQWDDIPKERKDYILKLLHDEYPQPGNSSPFNDKRMLKKIAKLVRSRRYEIYEAARLERAKPPYCSEEGWDWVRTHVAPNEGFGRQQRKAREGQSPSHLGSGGWATMKKDFRAYYSRPPTSKEKEYATSKGFNKLLEKMQAKCENLEEGVPPSPLHDSELSD